MEVTWVIEWLEGMDDVGDGEVGSRRRGCSHVVDDHIEHKEHVTFVNFRYKVVQVLLAAEVFINLVQAFCPISEKNNGQV